MKIIFHGFEFIHYAPIYLLEKDDDLKDFKFVYPKAGDNLNANYEIKDDEINIFLVGEDKFKEADFKNHFVNIVTLINQSPIYLLESKINTSNKFAQYEKGNSFHYIIQSFFNDTDQQDRLEHLNLRIVEDDEFIALNNGSVQYAISWNHWRTKEFENVKYNLNEIPIIPFGWTCLITKRRELQDEDKLNLMETLSKKIIKNINHIYRLYEREIYSKGNTESEREELINIVTKHVSERDKPYVSDALRLLATDRIWTRNPIYISDEVTDFTDYLLSESNKKATKSAVAEIVNRNYSHHIGSHVSHRATFDKIIERLGLEPKDILSNSNYFHTIIQMENKLNRYKDERNEFISAIASGAGTQSVGFYNDVMLPLIENSLLMDNIAANEGINYGDVNAISSLTQNKLNFECKINEHEIFANYLLEDGTNLTSKKLPYLKVVSDFNANFYKQKSNSIQDIKIGVPGALGKHALYSILENYIRNTAKHSPKENLDDNKVTIKLLISDNGTDFYKVRLTDNISIISEEALSKLQDGVNIPIRRKEKLGIQDMKINACLLAGKEITEEFCKTSLVVDSDKTLTDKEGNGILYYEFNILKAKKVVIIGNVTPNETLKQDGIYFYNSIEKFAEIETNQTFQFAVFSEDVLNDIQKLKKHICFLPNRILIQTSSLKPNTTENRGKYVEFNDTSFFETTDADLLVGKCWKIWLSRWVDSINDVCVNLYLDQNENDFPTEKWIEKETAINNDLNGFAKFSIWFKNGEEMKNKEVRESKNHILYDRHGMLLKADSTLCDLNLLDRNGYNLIDKNSKDFDRIFNTDLRNDKPELPFELIEAGMLRILLIDERIQEKSLDNLDKEWQVERNGFTKDGDFNLFDALWASKIFVATHLSLQGESEKSLKSSIDESKNHYMKLFVSKNSDGNVEMKFKQNFSQWTDENSKNKVADISTLKVDAVIIHRTILKDMVSKLGADVIEKLNEQIPFFYITTGGGVAHDIKEDVKIIPFATLQDYILSNKRISKFCLTQMMMNLTKNKF
jgi:hypothetical protein